MNKTKRIFYNIVAHGTLILSVVTLLLLFADTAYPTRLYVNSTDTGTILIVYCVFAFAAAILRILYSFRRERDGILSVIIPHGVIVMALMTLTLAITNIFNRSMGFVTSDISKLVFGCLAVFGLLLSLGLIECILKEVGKE